MSDMLDLAVLVVLILGSLAGFGFGIFFIIKYAVQSAIKTTLDELDSDYWDSRLGDSIRDALSDRDNNTYDNDEDEDTYYYDNETEEIEEKEEAEATEEDKQIEMEKTWGPSHNE
ncbi:MAG: hypothetical protein FWC89_09600 [Defluviitaleaceae bacterium]|nr:hypothetical protein [Defluviitaleaceae bacterium]